MYKEEKNKISKIAKNLYKDIKFETKNERGRLQLTKNGKWIYLGGPETRTYKLVKCVLESGKSKKVTDVFERIRIKKDNRNEDLKDEDRSYGIKKEIIKRAVDDLQRGKYLKGRLGHLTFNDKKGTVTINLKK